MNSKIIRYLSNATYKKEIVSFISEYFKKKDGVKVLKKIKNINLIESGLIDSLDLVTLSLN